MVDRIDFVTLSHSSLHFQIYSHSVYCVAHSPPFLTVIFIEIHYHQLSLFVYTLGHLIFILFSYYSRKSSHLDDMDSTFAQLHHVDENTKPTEELGAIGGIVPEIANPTTESKATTSKKPCRSNTNGNVKHERKLSRLHKQPGYVPPSDPSCSRSR